MKKFYLKRSGRNHVLHSAGMVLLMTSCIFSGNAQVNPTDGANGFNVVTAGDALAIQSESEGAWAVGGNLTIGGAFSLFGGTNSYNGDSEPTALIVNGNVNYNAGGINVLQNNYVKIGDLSTSTIHDVDNNGVQANTRITFAGGGFDSNPRILLSTMQSAASIGADPQFDFSGAFDVFQSLSECIGNLETNITWDADQYNSGKLWVDLIAGQTNIINLTSAEFNALSEIKFNTVTPSSTTAFVVNITDIVSSPNSMNLNSWPNVVGSSLDYAHHILYNFPNVNSQINYSGGSQIYGTIYAPSALFNNTSNSNVDGQIIASSLIQNSGEIHPVLFEGEIMCDPQVDPCVNVTDAGSIGYDQENCGAFDAAAIMSVEDASGGIGPVEYIWLYSDTLVPNTVGNPYWMMIPGATGSSYDPGVVTQTTYFIRCSRNEGCDMFLGESNVVTVEVHPVPVVDLMITDPSCPSDEEIAQLCNVEQYANNKHALWIPNLPNTSNPKFVFQNNSGNLQENPDGTAHLSGVVINLVDPNKGWYVDVHFAHGMNWADWSALGRSYKDEQNIVTNEYLDWMYYIMDTTQASTLIGWGDYAGTTLELTHRPSNYNYGLQVGQAANSKDDDYGFSCWFNYTSTDNALTGHGDFNADIECVEVVTCGGAVEAVASGGSAPYVYSWSNGMYGDNITGLCADTYTLTVTDVNGCSIDTTFTLSVPPCCNVTDAGSIGYDQENCGEFDVEEIISVEDASGGIGPVEYVWLYSDTLVPNTVGNPYWMMIPGATGASYDPGVVSQTTYFIRCARNEGCDMFLGESNVVTITVHDFAEVEVMSENVSCYGSCDGAASIVSISGGTAPYHQMWNNGSTNESIDGLCAGVYEVVVSTAEGCETTAHVEITQPEELMVYVESTPIACNGEFSEVTVSVTGGTAPYEGVGTFSVAAGEHVFDVVDANGCSNWVSIYVKEPEALVVNSTVTPISCYGGKGTVKLFASGGTGPYEGIGTFSLSAGYYEFMITDANGCTELVEVVMDEPDAINAEINSEGSACYNTCGATCTGWASVSNVTGGVAPYSYYWSTGATSSSIDYLCPGDYWVTIIDANKCTVTYDVTIDYLYGKANEPKKIGPKAGSAGIENIELVNAFEVFPNPSKGVVNVQLDFAKSVDASMKIVNAVGSTIAEYNLENDSMYRTQVNLENQADGVYYITVISDEIVLTKRIVIRH